MQNCNIPQSLKPTIQQRWLDYKPYEIAWHFYNKMPAKYTKSFGSVCEYLDNYFTEDDLSDYLAKHATKLDLELLDEELFGELWNRVGHFFVNIHLEYINEIDNTNEIDQKAPLSTTKNSIPRPQFLRGGIPGTGKKR